MGAYTNKPTLRVRAVQEMQFVRGSSKLYWKTSMDDGEYESGEFLKKVVSRRRSCEGMLKYPSLVVNNV